MSAPISDSPIHGVQVAIRDLLRDDDQLLEMVTDVFDQVPEDQPFDYVRIGDHLSVPDNAHGQFGRQITETIHIWTKARGNRKGQEIAERIGALLDHQPAALEAFLPAEYAAHRIVAVRQEFDQALADPDPQIRHHVLRFRITTSQED